ncbi:MAG: O-methyltransferase [Acidobacteriota bacterium]
MRTLCIAVMISVTNWGASDSKQLPMVETVIENYLQAIGGESRVYSVKSVSQKGRLGDNQHNPGGTAIDETWIAPDKWYNVDGATACASDGRTIWRKGPEGITEIVSAADRSSTAFWSGLSVFLRIREHFPQMRVTGVHSTRLGEAYRVEATDAYAVTYALYFHSQSGLLIKMQEWYVDDYRDVGGIKMPFSFYDEEGHHYCKYDKRILNPVFDQALLKMPDVEAFYSEAFEGIRDGKVIPLLRSLPHVEGRGGGNIPLKDGRFLYDMILQESYKRGLEIGTSDGYSALWIALAMRQTGGRLVTIEIDRPAAMQALDNFRSAGLAGIIDVRINDAFEEVPKLEGTFDFIFVDPGIPDYGPFFELVYPLLAPGGAILIHNAGGGSFETQRALRAIMDKRDLSSSMKKPSNAEILVSVRKTER